MRDHLGNFVLSSNLGFAKGISILDDCEGTFNWSVTGTDANVAGSYDTSAAFLGTNGILLVSGDADPAEDDYATIQKSHSFPESNLLVARARVCMPDISDIKAVYLNSYVINGTASFLSYFGYSPNDGKVKYLDSAGSYTEITDLAFTLIDGVWFNMELVIDCSGPYYYSCEINGLKYSLADLGLYNQGANTNRYVTSALSFTCSGAQEGTVYFDSIYVGEFLNI